MAIAKGAGMIEPNMATMLAYILTDLDVPKATLDAVLKVRRALFLRILPASSALVWCSAFFTYHPTPLWLRYPVPFFVVPRAWCLPAARREELVQLHLRGRRPEHLGHRPRPLLPGDVDCLPAYVPACRALPSPSAPDCPPPLPALVAPGSLIPRSARWSPSRRATRRTSRRPCSTCARSSPRTSSATAKGTSWRNGFCLLPLL